MTTRETQERHRESNSGSGHPWVHIDMSHVRTLKSSELSSITEACHFQSEALLQVSNPRRSGQAKPILRDNLSRHTHTPLTTAMSS